VGLSDGGGFSGCVGGNFVDMGRQQLRLSFGSKIRIDQFDSRFSWLSRRHYVDCSSSVHGVVGCCKIVGCLSDSSGGSGCVGSDFVIIGRH